MSKLKRFAWILFVTHVVLPCFAERLVADDLTAIVQGKVTLDGNPVAAGRVFFFIDEDQFVGANMKNGEFKIDRVPVGTHVVAVEAMGVPSRYSNKSVLRVEVKMGMNVVNFDFKGN